MSQTTDAVRLPFEGQAGDEEGAVTRLFDALGSDPEFSEEEAPEEHDEQPAEEAEDESQDSEPEEPAEEDEAEGEDGEGQDEDPGATYTVRVDGEEVKVTLDELLSGYSRTSDYTRKTMALSEQRKALETEAAATREARETYAQYLAQLEGVLKSQAPPEEDWDALRAKNPVEYAKRWADHERSQRQMQSLQAEQERVHREQRTEWERSLAEQVAKEKEALLTALPEWKDPATAKAEAQAIQSHAVETYGFAPEDFEGITDHRILLVFQKARKFDELQGTKGTIRERAKKARVVRPGGVQRGGDLKAGKRIDRARQQLAQSGNVNDAARVFLEMIPE